MPRKFNQKLSIKTDKTSLATPPSSTSTLLPLPQSQSQTQSNPPQSTTLSATEEYGLFSIDIWCLQGCGLHAQPGSKYCSPLCFRQALFLDQDIEGVNERLSRLSAASSAYSASTLQPSLFPATPPPSPINPTSPTSLLSSTVLCDTLTSVYGCLYTHHLHSHHHSHNSRKKRSVTSERLSDL